jgi:hypothetical protein
MHQLPVINTPPGAPNCWGQKYQDGDIECGQCRFNDTCKKEVLRGAMNAPPYPARTPAPYPPPPQSVVPFPRPITGAQPVSSNFSTPYAMSAPPPMAVHPATQYRPAQPVPVSLPTPFQQQPQFPIPGQQNQQYHPAQLPLEIPDPRVPWVRPGSSAPPHYFTQYPQESMGQRLGKNILMAIGAAIAGQLVALFTQWTWPPRRGNNNRD